MSWSRGSSLFSEVIEVIKNHVKDDNARESMYYDLIEAFESFDCDTLNECLGEDPIFDKVYNEIYPDETDFLEDEDE
jgi:hypothetical protein